MKPNKYIIIICIEALLGAVGGVLFHPFLTFVSMSVIIFIIWAWNYTEKYLEVKPT